MKKRMSIIAKRRNTEDHIDGESDRQEEEEIEEDIEEEIELFEEEVWRRDDDVPSRERLHLQ